MSACQECHGNRQMPYFTVTGGHSVPCRNCGGKGFFGTAPAIPAPPAKIRSKVPAPQALTMNEMDQIELILETAQDRMDELTEHQKAFVVVQSALFDQETNDFRLSAENAIDLSEIAIRLKIRAEGIRPGHWSWLTDL